MNYLGTSDSLEDNYPPPYLNPPHLAPSSILEKKKLIDLFS